MAKKVEEETGFEELRDLVDSISPLAEKFIEIQKPVTRRAQWMNFVIVMTLCLGIFGLSYFKVIEGAAATGLIGTVIGYVFSHLYPGKAGQK